MPKTFLKPFDYSTNLLLRPHPSLRTYLPMKEHAETDPEYHLYPYKRERITPTDEIMIRNNKNVGHNFGMTTLGAGQSMLTKSVAGAFINTLDVYTNDLVGNFGARVANVIPTDLSVVYRSRMTLKTRFSCDPTEEQIPMMMPAANDVDYLTDEDSDEDQGFTIKVPDLEDLLNEFEKDDDVVHQRDEKVQQEI